MGNWKDVVRNVAPALGAALSGPAGAALKVVSTVLLGKPDGTEEEIAERVKGWTPEDELKLRAAEQTYTLGLVDLAVKLETAEYADRASARAMQTASKSRMPAFLTIAAVVLFAGEVLLSHFVGVPVENQHAVDQMLGLTYAVVATAYGFWLGGSFGSNTKTSILGRLIEPKK